MKEIQDYTGSSFKTLVLALGVIWAHAWNVKEVPWNLKLSSLELETMFWRLSVPYLKILFLLFWTWLWSKLLGNRRMKNFLLHHSLQCTKKHTHRKMNIKRWKYCIRDIRYGRLLGQGFSSSDDLTGKTSFFTTAFVYLKDQFWYFSFKFLIHTKWFHVFFLKKRFCYFPHCNFKCSRQCWFPGFWV